MKYTAFCFSDVINTNTSNDSDKSDKTLVDVSISVCFGCVYHSCLHVSVRLPAKY